MSRLTTSDLYYKRAFQNARRCLIEAESQNNPFAKKVVTLVNPLTGESESVMAIDHAIIWCMKFHLPKWAPSTWRLTRNGYYALLSDQVENGGLKKETAEKLKQKMLSSFASPSSSRKRNTSSRRSKHANAKRIAEIEEHVSENNNRWGESLIIWLKAAILTGLRPNEWKTAVLSEVNGRVTLKSENFKHNDQRSYAPFREIDLTGLEPEMIELVKKHLRITHGLEAKGMGDLHYSGCSNLLLFLNKVLWPKRNSNITLYTGRHQFSSNAKADDECDEITRAALMGHKTVTTSREKYGRKRHGSKGLTPNVANPEVLSLIKDAPMPARTQVRNANAKVKKVK